MCRMGIYVGKKIALQKVIFDSPHNFVSQALKPKEMVAATLNGDGFGLAWFNREMSTEPALITSEKPFWHDINLPRIAGKIESDLIFMHVRAASPGLPVHQANAHPFVYGSDVFMHNGIVSDFRSGFMRLIREKTTDPFYENIQGTTDSEHMFAYYLTLRQKDEILKKSVPLATHQLIRDLNVMSQVFNTDLVLNLAISDGITTVVTRYTNIEKSASLYYTLDSTNFPDGVMISSERLSIDDDSWKEFPINHLVVLENGKTPEFQPLDNPFVKGGILERKAKKSTLLA